MGEKFVEFANELIRVFPVPVCYTDNEWLCPHCFGHNIQARCYTVEMGVLEHTFIRILLCEDCRRSFATRHTVDAVVIPNKVIVDFLEQAWQPHL